MIDRASPRIDGFGHLGGLAGGLLLGALLEGRIAGSFRVQREWLPLPTAVITTVLLLVYGIGGMAVSLPRQADLIRAARSQDLNIRADYLERVADRYPYFVELHSQLVDVLRQVGRLDEAARYLRNVRGNGETSIYQRTELERLAVQALGRAAQLSNARLHEAALPEYLRAAELTVNDELRAQAYNGYAWTLAEFLVRDLDQAEKYALRAVELDRTSSAIVDTLAWVYYRQGRYQEALERQQVALELAEREQRGFRIQPLAGSEYAELYYHLGAIHEKLDRREDARLAYARALEKRQPYPEAEAGLNRLSQPATPAPDATRSAAPKPRDPDLDPAFRRGVI